MSTDKVPSVSDVDHIAWEVARLSLHEEVLTPDQRREVLQGFEATYVGFGVKDPDERPIFRTLRAALLGISQPIVAQMA